MSFPRVLLALAAVCLFAACDSAGPDASQPIGGTEISASSASSNLLFDGELLFDIATDVSGPDMYLVRRDGSTLGCETGSRQNYAGFGYHNVTAQYLSDSGRNDCDLFSTQFYTDGDYVAYVPGQQSALTLDLKRPGSSECSYNNHDSSYRYTGELWLVQHLPEQTCVTPSIDFYSLDQNHAVLAENFHTGGMLLDVALAPNIDVDGRGSFNLANVERSDVRFRYTRPNGTTATTWRYNVGHSTEIIVTPKNNTSVQVLSRLRSQPSETHTTSHHYTTSTGNQDVPCKRFDTRPHCSDEF